jgi:hypothetical protein
MMKEKAEETPRPSNMRMKVCQKMFLNIDTDTVVEKRRNSEGGICPEDGRGKHQTHPKAPERELEQHN